MVDSQRQKVHDTSLPGPSNYRDASHLTSPWKKPPTVINAPSQMRNVRPGPASPYDSMNSNIRRPQHQRSGNPTACATILGTPPQPKASVPKCSQRDTFPKNIARQINCSRPTNDVRASSRHAVHPVTEVQSNNRHRGMESTLEYHRSYSVVTISDEDSDPEDIGVSIPRHRLPTPSTDPLNLSSSRDIHPFQTRPGNLQHAGPRKGKGKDIAPKPQANAAAMPDVEEIESFTSESANDRSSAPRPPRSQPAATLTPCIPPGLVGKQRGVFETEVQLDLRRKNALDGRTQGVMKKMKPKGATKPPSSTSQLDPIATQSTSFTSKSLPRTKETSLKLPLRRWAMGLKIFHSEQGSDPHFFEYNPQNGRLDVSVPGESQSYWFQQPNGFEEIKVTNDSGQSLRDNVAIQLYTKSDCSFCDHGFSESEFKPGGERLTGTLTFVFSPDEVKGWTTTYQKLISLLMKTASKHSTLRPTGGKSLWEEVLQHAEMLRMCSTHSSDSCNKSIALPIENVSSLSAPPSSRATPQTRSGPDPKPSNAEVGLSVPPRRSSRRLAAAATEVPSEAPPLADPEELILVYPPSGPGALNIMGSDLNRLRPHEFLNDTLIEFGLKLWLTELGKQDADLANQIHVFSSFFYKKLNNKKSLDEGYQSVKKWTSRVDIFSKKYIVVPINENLHWYLAIIYEPEHTLQPPFPQQEYSFSQRDKLRRKTAAQPGIDLDIQKEPYDLQSAEGPSELDVEMASLHATCASTPSVTQDEGMDDISPIEFAQSCSISNIAPERPRSASSSNPVSMRGRSASIGKASGRSISAGARSIELMLPSHLDTMDVDAPMVAVEAEAGTELKGDLVFCKASTSTLIPDPPSAPSSKPPSRGTGVPPSQFYGRSSGRKGKQKADEQHIVPDSEAENDGEDDEKQEKEVDVMLGGVGLPNPITHIANDPPQTRIFTLDSLGSRHPQAIKVLKYWLQAEAKDKRQFDEVRIAEGKIAQVPSQPNFADCGIYLLHFAKTFLSKPAYYFDLIYQSKKLRTPQQCRLDWDEAVVQHFREDLIERITRLSVQWKVSRALKEEDAKRKRKSEELAQGESDSSDVEVDIVEDIKVPRASPKQRPAKRMRG